MSFMKRNLIVITIFFSAINFAIGGIVNWGERCEYTAECGDHRLVCDAITVKNITQKICICDRFHKWNGTLVGCLLKYKTVEMLALFREKYNVSGHIELEANLIYTTQIAAGLLVLAVGLVCSVVVTGYCYRIWRQDTDLDNIVTRLESQKLRNKATTSRPAR